MEAGRKGERRSRNTVFRRRDVVPILTCGRFGVDGRLSVDTRTAGGGRTNEGPLNFGESSRAHTCLINADKERLLVAVKLQF